MIGRKLHGASTQMFKGFFRGGWPSLLRPSVELYRLIRRLLTVSTTCRSRACRQCSSGHRTPISNLTLLNAGSTGTPALGPIVAASRQAKGIFTYWCIKFPPTQPAC